MKKTLLVIILFIGVLSCTEENEKEECTCADVNLDLAVSIGYAIDSSRAEVCVNDASSNIPVNSIVSIVNSYSSKCAFYYGNGNYEATISVILPNGIKCSKTEAFEIIGLR